MTFDEDVNEIPLTGVKGVNGGNPLYSVSEERVPASNLVEQWEGTARICVLLLLTWTVSRLSAPGMLQALVTGGAEVIEKCLRTTAAKECWKQRLQLLEKDLGSDGAPMLDRITA